MFWCSRSSDGYKAVSCWPVSAVVQPSEHKLSSSKQSNLAPAMPPDHARSPSPVPGPSAGQLSSSRLLLVWQASVTHKLTSTLFLAGLCPAASFHQREKTRSFPRLSFLQEIESRCCVFQLLTLRCCVHSSQLLFLPPFEMSVSSGLSWTRLVPA